jgi:hypothetical protein
MSDSKYKEFNNYDRESYEKNLFLFMKIKYSLKNSGSMSKIKTNDVTVKIKMLSLMLNSITSDSVLIVEGRSLHKIQNERM